jgi:2-C-methyl-D-erythritol 4-phosphate cytidylyltransferase
MRADLPKQYLPLAGRPLLAHAIGRMVEHPAVRGVVVALRADDELWATAGYATDARVRIVAGGAERCHSVLNALVHLDRSGAGEDWVLVHDAARPCVRAADIDALLRAGAEHPVGALLAVPVRDTMKRAGPGGEVIATVDRGGLWHAQTPQMFRVGRLKSALESALAGGVVVTDEAQALERLGHAPLLVPGHADNIKVTEPYDYWLAEALLARQREE